MIYCRGRTSGRKGFVSTRNINLSRNTYLSNQCKPVRKEEMGGGEEGFDWRSGQELWQLADRLRSPRYNASGHVTSRDSNSLRRV